MTPRVLTSDEIEHELASLTSWEIHNGWLRRVFTTPGWTHTLMLTNHIGFLAEAAWHHPDLELGYARVVVKLQTHQVRAITALDFALARQIEQLATWQPEESSPLSGFPKGWIR